MEQPCYKCRQLVEEGRPFCPHCGAPQIRVLVAEPVAAVGTGPEPVAGAVAVAAGAEAAGTSATSGATATGVAAGAVAIVVGKGGRIAPG